MPAKQRSILVALLLLSATTVPQVLAAQLAPPATGGVLRVDELLQRLTEPRRVLVIGAHPDDEDSSILALFARGYGAAAAYLSLSRGEGGQNLIGNELGIDLGVVRTGELEAARSVDGARQFFTRAYDFGYTRALSETETFWLPDSILKDVVRVIRRFRPHVLVSVFSGTPRDGHGQHQMSGVMARRAYEVAGDADVFPELAFEERLEPWTPLKLYRSTRFDTAATTLHLATGGLDSRSGRTYHQIAMASRSRHRSQDFGVLQRTGPAETHVRLLATRVAEGQDSDLFDGIPRETSAVLAAADSLRHTLSASHLGDAVPGLARMLRGAQGTRPASLETADPVSPDARRLHEALAVAAGLVLDVRTEDAELVAGQEVGIEAVLYNAGSQPVRVFAVAVSGAAGNRERTMPAGVEITPGLERSFELVVRVPPPGDARPTRPYFLASSKSAALYDWPSAPPEVRGRPFGAPALMGEILIEVGGTWIRMHREVSRRYADQAIGEIREPVRIVPLVDVKLTPHQLVWPVPGPSRKTFSVTIQSNGDDPLEGEVSLEIDGWRNPAPAPAPVPFRLERNGESRQIDFPVSRPPRLNRADVTIRAVARLQDGQTFNEGVRVLTYPHIRSRQVVDAAVSAVRIAPITLPLVRSIGYVRGASDRVPEALERIGVKVELIDAAMLAGADLSRFDVIVVGSRAYETDTALVRHNDRLLAYARDGGHLVVQYQQYAFVRGGYAPFPLDIARPHDRITDETAPVTVLDPDHRLFTMPNRIRDDDWDDWPQERGLYFAHTWDDAYTPLLEMQDPDRDPIRGGMLVARVGQGTYVYTGLSFFRALPAGTVGAFRLFVNLLDLGRVDVP